MINFDVECNFNKKYSIVTRKILRMLSEDARITITSMAKELKLSRKEVAKRLEHIEKEFDIKYTLELSKTRIGFNNPHLILVKFKDKPDYKKLAALFERSYIPQLVVPVRNGTYDLFVYANSSSFRDYVQWDRDMRRELMLKYNMQWEQSQIVLTRLGHIPLRDVIIQRARIPEDEKKMLVVLNENSRISFKELASKLGINYKTCIYDFNIVKKKYIKRFTLSITKPPHISIMSLFAKYVPTEAHERASSYSRRLYTTDEQNSLISRYILKMSLIGSYDSFAIGVFDCFEDSYTYTVQSYRQIFDDFSPTRIVYGELGEPLLGTLPIRSMDIKKEYPPKRRHDTYLTNQQ
ncbi:MAG: AsnC family transcriptional regulator [Candidatus Marsarchaeota archaeon]|nr:AsnC family transcriptional regulator [Candidatus Marsarchaeota archaeon]